MINIERHGRNEYVLAFFVLLDVSYLRWHESFYESVTCLDMGFLLISVLAPVGQNKEETCKQACCRIP